MSLVSNSEVGFTRYRRLTWYLLCLTVMILRIAGQKDDGDDHDNHGDHHHPPAVIRVALVLTTGSDLPYDYTVLAPAIEAAFEKSLTEYNVHFSPVLCLYQGGCDSSAAAGQTFIAVNSSVDLIIGPACTADMLASMEIQSFFQVPSITGGGELADSIKKYPYATRCAFNTYTQWLFVIRVFTQFNWTNIAIIYDNDDNTKSVNAISLMKNIRAVNMRHSDFIFSGRQVRENVQAQNYLTKASKTSRVFVLLMNGVLIRTFMIGASTLGYTNGDYVFLALDTFRDDILGVNGWEQKDRFDSIAQQAYGSLLVLTLRDTSSEQRYQDFKNHVTSVAEELFPLTIVKFNYYVASFYDAVMVFAQCFNETLEEGHSVGKDNVFEVAGKASNRTFPGATGLVYINSDGDRYDDHAMYDIDANGVFKVAAEFFGYKEELVNEYFYDPIRPFNWNSGPENLVPRNEPLCGYTGEKAICDKTGEILEIALGLCVVLTLIALVIFGISYSIIHRRSEMAQLNILGTWNDVTRAQTATVNYRVSRKITPDLGSHVSLDPRGLMDNPNLLISSGSQTTTATFRGTRVMLRVCETEQVSTGVILKEVKIARSIASDNVATLAGICTGPYRVAVMYGYCAKGSLADLLATETVLLDWLFRFSLIKDIVQGLLAVTNSPLLCHGHLTSGCIFVDDHFVAKIGDYGLPSFFRRTMPSIQDSTFCASLLWTAPERLPRPFENPTTEGDVYSLAIILSEIVMRERPFLSSGFEPEVIIAKVQKKHHNNFRPKMDANLCPPEISVMIKQCWAHNPMERPRMAQIKSIIKESEKNNSEKGTILDNLIRRMEINTQDLETIVEEKAELFKAEKEKSDQLLYQILPRVVVDALKRGEQVQPENFDSVTVYYSDIVAFTTLSSSSSPTEVVDLLNDLYTIFDNSIMKFDAYKVASGVPVRNGNQHAGEICRLSLLLLDQIKVFKIRHRPDEQLRLRLGANTGPCVSGVVGLVMPRYCLFGETITIAGKMESTSLPMRIQISESCEKMLQTCGKFETELRPDGPIIVNDKWEVTTYWLHREILP
ncbi:Atrial natriuretic peptide receptor 1 [Hypsibius exemplaris]|uniref:Guanylate cyclase n=1 Tax=Hypsibius exemplaris TaxID=2072580 RepID=A0A1W0WSP1_HYPEX|nr:Atrial natriuretic peptide receptor 1 [Hypsibius exemplaris]